MPESNPAPDIPAHERGGGEGRIPCPLCDKECSTEGWLGHHLVKAHPGYLSKTPRTRAGDDPTLKYKLAAEPYMEMLLRRPDKEDTLAWKSLKRIGAV